MQRRLTPLALGAAVALLAGSLATGSAAEATAKAKAPLVDINSASPAELKTLPGIGDVEATRIIAARPYPSKAKLVADKVLSIQAYDALRGHIVARQKGPPPTGKP